MRKAAPTMAKAPMVISVSVKASTKTRLEISLRISILLLKALGAAGAHYILGIQLSMIACWQPQRRKVVATKASVPTTSSAICLSDVLRTSSSHRKHLGRH